MDMLLTSPTQKNEFAPDEKSPGPVDMPLIWHQIFVFKYAGTAPL